MTRPQINVNTMGPFGLLWVLFILLRVIEVITWPWLIVILWPVGIWVALFLVAFLCVLGYALYQDSKSKKVKESFA